MHDTRDERFERAQAAFRAGDLEGAAAQYRALLDDASGRERGTLAWLLGGVYSDLGQYDEALRYTEEALRIHPASEAASIQLFHALYLLGRYRDALSELRRFVAPRPSPAYAALIRELLAVEDPGSGERSEDELRSSPELLRHADRDDAESR